MPELSFPAPFPAPFNPTRPSVPAWLIPGALVKVSEWIGVVVDVAISETRVMVMVISAKNLSRGQSTEWLEYVPDMIEPATPEQARQDMVAARRRIKRMTDGLAALEKFWATEGEA